MSASSKEDLYEVWRKLIFTFPHEVTLQARGTAAIQAVLGDTHEWLEQQGWRRGASSHSGIDWGVDYRDSLGDIAVFGFHDPDKAMLFKLTWGGQ